MKARELREAFATARVAFDHNRILVIYPDDNGAYVGQYMDGENKKVFERLISESAKVFFILNPSPNHGFSIQFEFDYPVYDGTVYFQPLERMLTDEEFMAKNPPPKNPKVKIEDFFVDADIHDENDILSRFGDFLQATIDVEAPETRSLSSYANWKKLEEFSKNFNRFAAGAEIEYSPPDNEAEGGLIEYCFWETKNRIIRFSENKKDVLSRMVSLSDSVSFQIQIIGNALSVIISFCTK